MRKGFIIILLLLIGEQVFSQTPIYSWNFNNGDLKDKHKGKVFDVKTYSCNVELDENTIKDNGDCLAVTNVLSSSIIKESFTIEFLFKGNSFLFTTFPKPFFRIRLEGETLQFSTTHLSAGKNVEDNWIIKLRGSSITSNNYLQDNNWHHFFFIYDKNRGVKQIWIDGLTDPLFSKSGLPKSKLYLSGGDGLKFNGELDDLKFYGQPLKSSSIIDDSKNSKIKATSANIKSKVEYKIDPKEFAPGYPNYTIQGVYQLKQFPRPRFSERNNLPRNFSWVDISYLHREFKEPRQRVGVSDPSIAVQIAEELYRNWNYYLDIPILRTDSVQSAKRYSDVKQFEGALVNFARQNPNFLTSSVIFQNQANPRHAGFNRNRPFSIAQDLESSYYLHDNNGKVVNYKNKKWLNPFTGVEAYKKDGITTAFYLKQVQKYLGRPIHILNDNGEVFGHMRPQDLIEKDPRLLRIMKSNSWTVQQLNGWWQFRFDSTYKQTILEETGWANSLFSIYNTSAVNSNYWPDYSFRKKTNSPINGAIRSTPSFYPAFPWNWSLANGPFNGYGVIAEGRLKEIAGGQPLFSPFVSAGWELEENNIRPAQWLGLLKSMVMLGADFFYVGYFNVTGNKGWPNGKGPNDPRGYFYQVVMPVYAQAIASHLYPFLTKGELVYNSGEKRREYMLRFAASKPNHLVMVRKLGKQYLVFGSVQPNSNFIGNTPISEITSIELENKRFNLEIRRQGSVYIINMTDPIKPVIRQLDKWHQYEHPSYWTPDIIVEAENSEHISGEYLLSTETPKEKGDYSNFKTYVEVSKTGKVEINPWMQPGKKYNLYLCLKNVSNKQSNVVIITGKDTVHQSIKKNSWDLYKIKKTFEDIKTITVESKAGKVQFDYLILKEEDGNSN